ncbi:uncharacterized protein LOC125501447 [Athalia rosae]|uniref:uncharacterized protein LOC125501447 n=1 Tax=Athalia rosae TaxID=37344 RepID=UPI002033DFB0|nr:uncharacterized protein LOC125501447 [Athalia rosae]
MKRILTETIPFVEEYMDSTESEIKNVDLREGSERRQEELEDENHWQEWAKSIQSRVLSQLCDKGNRDNAHFLPSLVVRVLRDFKWFPLWSCICQAHFSYGRVPASSATVEADFNNIKTRVFGASNLPIRADLFVMRHLDYINGRVKIVDAKIQANEMMKDQKTNTDIQGKTKDTDTPTCPACDGNDKPTGAHICELCKRTVHALDGCSIPLVDDEEGYGQRRMYMACSAGPITNKPRNVTRTNSVEKTVPGILKDITNIQQTLKRPVPTALKQPPEKLPKSCSACNRGDLPTDTYTCALCGKSVHELEGCSVSFGQNEGCGLRRICLSCRRIPSPSIAHSLDSGVQENWRGLTVPASKKKGRYLQKNYSQNLFLIGSKITKVPVLKNGSCLNLMPVTLKCGKVTLVRTCGFDSVFQILLVTTIDNIEFQRTILQVSTNELFKIVLDAEKNGITKNTHHRRANILYDIVPETNKE